LNNKKFNFYGSTSFEKNLENPEFKVGATLLTDKVTADNRIKLSSNKVYIF
jgi:hypothetical protein